MGSPPIRDGDPTRAARSHQARRIALALALLFAVLVALRVHGFSLAAWHDVIDGSAPSEILLGAPRPIRSDDWKVHVPLILAQRAASPAYPEVNPNVGLGQNMLLPIETPVLHWATLFRPTLWGYFLGADVGLAWHWWSRALGLFGIWLGVFAVIARGRIGLAALGAGLLVASPFFQFWALNAAPHAMALGACFLAAAALLRADTPRRIAAAGLGLGLAGGWLALAVYPPYQITLAWLGVALLLGFALDRRAVLPLARARGLRAGAFLAAGALALAIVAAFAFETRDAIEAMLGTAYPGRRLSSGAERSVAQLLNANLGAPLWAESWGPLFNVCEAASFWMLSPAVVALLGWRRLRGERIDALSACVAIYAAALWIYAVLGFPEWLARATGLGNVPGRRAVIGIGLADAILVVRFASQALPERLSERAPAAAIALAFAALTAAAAWHLERELPGARLPWLAGFVAANAALALALFVAPARGLAALVAASALSSLWFNPLAVGGTAYLRENELSRRILELDAAEGGESVWVSFGRDDLGNLFRALGVRSLVGVQPLPQTELWRRIDPQGRQRSVYDRYAHVAFVASRAPPRFQLHSQDYVIVSIDPRSPAFRALGVTHVLVRDDDAAAFERLTGFAPLASVGPNRLYRVPRE
jgi:hypothetical protein